MRGAAIPNKRIIRTEVAGLSAPARRMVAPALRCAQVPEALPGTSGSAPRSGSAAAAFRFTRLLDNPAARRQEVSALRAPATGSQTESIGLSARAASAVDLPWLQTWAAQLGLPAPRSRRVRSFVLFKDSQRAGYLAVRDDMVDAGRGHEPILWIVSAFLIPSLRGQGLILRYCEILSQQYYRKGKVGCRVASDNIPMLKLTARSGWKKLHSTQRYIDFMMDLDRPFRASRMR